LRAPLVPSWSRQAVFRATHLKVLA
jgi:hypothetical protein